MSRRKKYKHLLSRKIRQALIEDIIETLIDFDEDSNEEYVEIVTNGYNKPGLRHMADEALIARCVELNENINVLGNEDEDDDDDGVKAMIDEAKKELENAKFHKEVKTQLTD